MCQVDIAASKLQACARHDASVHVGAHLDGPLHGPRVQPALGRTAHVLVMLPRSFVFPILIIKNQMIDMLYICMVIRWKTTPDHKGLINRFSLDG